MTRLYARRHWPPVTAGRESIWPGACQLQQDRSPQEPGKSRGSPIMTCRERSAPEVPSGEGLLRAMQPVEMRRQVLYTVQRNGVSLGVFFSRHVWACTSFLIFFLFRSMF